MSLPLIQECVEALKDPAHLFAGGRRRRRVITGSAPSRYSDQRRHEAHCVASRAVSQPSAQAPAREETPEHGGLRRQVGRHTWRWPPAGASATPPAECRSLAAAYTVAQRSTNARRRHRSRIARSRRRSCTATANVPSPFQGDSTRPLGPAEDVPPGAVPSFSAPAPILRTHRPDIKPLPADLHRVAARRRQSKGGWRRG